MNKMKLGNILDVKRGASLSGAYYSDHGDKIRLTLGNFDYPASGFKKNTTKENLFFTGDVKPEFILKKGDIITPLTEQVAGLLGETARIPVDSLYIQSGDIGLVIPNEKVLDKSFAYYLIASPIVKKQLSAAAQQTKIRHTSPDKIKDCIVYLPDLKQQKYTGQLLDSINSKIELNNKINAELEQMAKTLYDYWFVQFDFPDENGKPYKSSGGEMAYSNELKREIPKGWEVGSLLDIADYINGLPCQKFRPVDEKNVLRVIKIREMHDGFSSDTELVRADIAEKAIIINGDVLFAWSASLEVKMWSGGRGALNQHIFKVVSDRYPKSYYYYQLVNYLEHFKMMAENRKTTMGHITQEHLEQSRIVLPPRHLTDNLEKLIAPIFKTQINVEIENHKLAELRDWLLPILINGQVTMN